jgi:hypothetical protein
VTSFYNVQKDDSEDSIFSSEFLLWRLWLGNRLIFYGCTWPIFCPSLYKHCLYLKLGISYRRHIVRDDSFVSFTIKSLRQWITWYLTVHASPLISLRALYWVAQANFTLQPWYTRCSQLTLHTRTRQIVDCQEKLWSLYMRLGTIYIYRNSTYLLRPRGHDFQLPVIS